MALTERLLGRLLVATPRLTDPNFARTVVLVLDHHEQGALGIVVNRPLELDVSAVLPGWQPHVTSPGRLFRGGPVGLDSALGVVAVPGGVEPAGVRRIAGAFGLVDLDTRPDAVAGRVTGLRIFAGYAGWGAAQLETEIADRAWYVVDAEARDPFTDRPELLWSQVLRRQRAELAFVATYPADPSHN